MIHDLQKASLLKRFSAYLIDVIVMIILITGLIWAISTLIGFSDYTTELETIIDSYEQEFNLNFSITNDEYGKMTDEEKEYFNTSYDKVIKDERYSYLTTMVFYSLITIVSISLFLSHLVLEFIVPICLKDGQTIGKKIFSIAVMRTDCIRVSPVVMFMRAILGKYTVETMIPTIIVIMMIFGVGSYITLAVLFLIFLLQIILVIATKTNSFIHDILSSTVVVDLQSQMIFDSLEAKNEYILRLHSEDAKNAKYF